MGDAWERTLKIEGNDKDKRNIARERGTEVLVPTCGCSGRKETEAELGPTGSI